MDRSLFARAVFVALLLGFTATSSAFDQVSYCIGTCPDFTHVTKIEDYEERIYEESVWICSPMQEGTYQEARAAFLRLYNCVSGNTWPVLLRKKGDDYRMCFFKAPEVTLCDHHDFTEMTIPKSTMFARFSEERTIEDGKHQADLMKKDLEFEGKHIQNDTYYGAGYSSPLSLWQNNEVWVQQAD